MREGVSKMFGKRLVLRLKKLVSTTNSLLCSLYVVAWVNGWNLIQALLLLGVTAYFDEEAFDNAQSSVYPEYSSLEPYSRTCSSICVCRITVRIRHWPAVCHWYRHNDCTDNYLDDRSIWDKCSKALGTSHVAGPHSDGSFAHYRYFRNDSYAANPLKV